MSTLLSPFTRFAPRQRSLRRPSALVLTFGIAAATVGAIMVGAGLEVVPAMPPLSPLAVERVIAAGIAPEIATVCPCPNSSSPEAARVDGIAMHHASRQLAPILHPLPAPETVFDLDRLARLERHATRMEEMHRTAAGSAPTVTPWTVLQDSPSDRRAYLLGVAMQARSPARAALVPKPGRQGTASFCPSRNPATCRPSE